MGAVGSLSRKRKRRVLVADQSITIQKLVHLSLADSDVEVITAADGPDALIKIKRLRPEVVLLENHLPEMNGQKVFQELQQNASLNGAKMILLQPNQEEATETDKEGFDEVLSKPFDSKILVETIDRLLGNEPTFKPSHQEESPFQADHAALEDLREEKEEDVTENTQIPLSEVEPLPQTFTNGSKEISEEIKEDSISAKDRLLAIADEVASGEEVVSDEEDGEDTMIKPEAFESTPVASSVHAETIELNEDSLIGTDNQKVLSSKSPTGETPFASEDLVRQEVQQWIKENLPKMAEKMIKDELSRLK